MIRLICIKEKSKLRVRFLSFIDNNGKIHNNVYDNTLNCRFPRNIRKENRIYEVPLSAISLSNRNTKPFYIVNKKNIKIIEEKIDLSKIKIYEISDCVICLDSKSKKVIVPCGHKCLCNECNDMLKSQNINKCPICRSNINSIV